MMRMIWLSRDSWKALAVPAKVPCMVAGTPMVSMECLIAASASPSAYSGGRLKEIVEAAKWPWWLTASGVVPGPKWLKAASGIMVSLAVLIAAPVEALLWVVLAMELRLALRAASLAT